MTTLAEFRSAIRDEGNFHEDDVRVTDELINRNINRTIKRISMLRDWPWLQETDSFALVADVTEYPLPIDFMRSLSLTKTDGGEEITLRSPKDVDLHVSRGGPTVYAIYGDSLIIAPAPTNDTFVLHRYIRTEKFLSQDNASPLLPTYWDDAVIEGALALVYRAVKHVEEAGIAEANFLRWVKDNTRNISQSAGAPRVHVRPGSLL